MMFTSALIPLRRPGGGCVEAHLDEERLPIAVGVGQDVEDLAAEDLAAGTRRGSPRRGEGRRPSRPSCTRATSASSTETSSISVARVADLEERLVDRDDLAELDGLGEHHPLERRAHLGVAHPRRERLHRRRLARGVRVEVDAQRPLLRLVGRELPLELRHARPRAVELGLRRSTRSRTSASVRAEVGARRARSAAKRVDLGAERGDLRRVRAGLLRWRRRGRPGRA